MRTSLCEEEDMYSAIKEHQFTVEDIILQNWIATQELAKNAPAFQLK